MSKTIVPTLPMPPSLTPDALKALTDETLSELLIDSSEVHRKFDEARGLWLTHWCRFYDEIKRRKDESAMREKLLPEVRAEVEAALRAELNPINPEPAQNNESR